MSDVFSYIDEANVFAWTKLDMLRLNLEAEVPALIEFDEGDCSGLAMENLRQAAEKFGEIHGFLITLLDNIASFMASAGTNFCALDQRNAEELMAAYWESASFDPAKEFSNATNRRSSSGGNMPSLGRRGYYKASAAKSTSYTCAVSGLVRDYSMRQQEELLEIIDSITPQNNWQKFGDWFGDIGLAISSLFGTLSIKNHVDDLDKYHKRIFDRRDYTRDAIIRKFEEVRATEPRYGAFLGSYGQSISMYYNYTKALSERISGTMNAGQMISTLAGLASLQSLLEQADALVAETNLNVAGCKEIDDIELKEFCEKVYSIKVFWGFTYYQVMLAEINMGDVFLIALLEREEVIFDTIKGAYSLGGLLKEMIMQDKFDRNIISEMAQKTGMSEDKILHWLRTGRLAGYIPPRGEHYLNNDVRQELYTDVQMRNLYLTLCAELLKDEKNLQLISEETGYNLDIVKAMVNGDIDSYSLTRYKKLIADSLESVRGKNELKEELRLDFLNEYVSYVKEAKTLGSEISFEVWYAKLNKRKGRTISASEYKMARECYDNWNGVFSFVSDGTKLFKYLDQAEDGKNLLIDLLTEYSSTVEALDALVANSENADATYQLALTKLREEYSSQMVMILNKAKDALVDKVGGEALDAVTDAIHKHLGPKFGNGPSLYAVVTTGIDVAADVTGASEYASATMDLIGLTTICSAQSNAYMDAVLAVRQMEEPTEEALKMVRLTFEAAKQAHIDVYKAMIKRAENHILGINEDQSEIAYLEEQLRRLENLQLGEEKDAYAYVSFE